MDLGRVFREQVRQVVEAAKKGSGPAGRHTNVAAAVNVGRSGGRTWVYSDDEVTIVQQDGETRVIRHGEDAG